MYSPFCPNMPISKVNPLDLMQGLPSKQPSYIPQIKDRHSSSAPWHLDRGLPSRAAHFWQGRAAPQGPAYSAPSGSASGPARYRPAPCRRRPGRAQIAPRFSRATGFPGSASRACAAFLFAPWQVALSSGRQCLGSWGKTMACDVLVWDGVLRA